jgi:hypothetical protein
MLSAKQLVLRQAVEQPTKPTESHHQIFCLLRQRGLGCGNRYDLLLNILNLPKGKSAMPNFSEHIVRSVWHME